MPQAWKAFDHSSYYSTYSLLLCPNTLPYNQLFPHIFMPLASIPKNKSLARLVLYSVQSKKPSAWPRILHFQLGSYVHFQWPGIHSLCLLVISLSKNYTTQKITNKPYNSKSSKYLFFFFFILWSIECAAFPPSFSERKATIYKHIVGTIVSQTIKSLIAESSPLGKFVAKYQFRQQVQNIALFWDLTPSLISVTL